MEAPHADVRTEQLKHRVDTVTGARYDGLELVRRMHTERRTVKDRLNLSEKLLFLSRATEAETLAYILLLLLLFPLRRVLPRARWHQDRIFFLIYIFFFLICIASGSSISPCWLQFLAVRKSERSCRFPSDEWGSERFEGQSSQRTWLMLQNRSLRSDWVQFWPEPRFSWHDLHCNPCVPLWEWCDASGLQAVAHSSGNIYFNFLHDGDVKKKKNIYHLAMISYFFFTPQQFQSSRD